MLARFLRSITDVMKSREKVVGATSFAIGKRPPGSRPNESHLSNPADEISLTFADTEVCCNRELA
ncbi:hypothetical protein WI37_08425 [Burkholderia ubonensis]|nr:hypothetical protein WI37_08425 [Burkholderia ubonensis]